MLSRAECEVLIEALEKWQTYPGIERMLADHGWENSALALRQVRLINAEIRCRSSVAAKLRTKLLEMRDKATMEELVNGSGQPGV
jgi:hypothetical protein